MRKHLMASVVVVFTLTAAAPPQKPGGNFTVRCLNKDSLAKYDSLGKLDLEVEVTLTLDQEDKLKPGDFRLALLDARLRQLEGTSVSIPEDWKRKAFKKGANKDTLTVQAPAPGTFKEGHEYYLVVIIRDQIRFVKFKVGAADR